ncbi:MAG: hypothetical protein IT320_07920 [Anaerolineae bacterium]|nr:hypothetical protein [Anaerolineae bacterium]
MQIDPLRGSKILSERFTKSLDELALQDEMILVTCSGTIGNTCYVNATFRNAVGSPDILRIVANESEIPPGYLYIFLNSPLGNALIQQKTYGGVIQHIESHHVLDLLVPRIRSDVETAIHNLAKEASNLRVRANDLEDAARRRFHEEVLGISSDDIHWEHNNEHAFAVDVAQLEFKHHRLDAFHYIGYVADARLEHVVWDRLETLVTPSLPGMFKRPYVAKGGVPLLSGMDMYNAYPKPRIFISPQMPNLGKYRVRAGTILVQCSGQRYGLFGRPVILPTHLDNVAVSQHMVRIYPKNPSDRGFVYIWLSTGFGRRMLIKQSYGTSMGELSEQSILDTLAPACSEALRHSFEVDVAEICELRERANEFEDEAQHILLGELGWQPEM